MRKNTTNKITLNARTQTGQRLNVTEIVGAVYDLIIPGGIITKTLADMTIEYIDHLGDNYLIVTLPASESTFSGTCWHQLKVSFDGENYEGCILRPEKITFQPDLVTGC